MMMKLGGDRCIVQKSRPILNLGVISPGCAPPPPEMWRSATDVGKISACCLVSKGLSVERELTHLTIVIFGS